MDVIGQRALFPQFQEQSGGHALAEDRIEHVDRELVRMQLRYAAPADADMSLFTAFRERLGPGASGLRRGLDGDRRAGGKIAEPRPHGSDGFRLIDPSGDRDDDPRRRVVRIHEFAEPGGGQSEDDRLPAGDLPPEWMVRVEKLVNERVHPVLRLVAVHPDLLDDDVAFRLHVGVSKERRTDQIGDDVERKEVVPGGDEGREDRRLFIGRCVHRAAHALDLLADLGGARPVRGPLEDHVFEEVAGARVDLRL